MDSSLAVAGGVGFVASYDGKVYALNAATGVWIWEYETGDSVGSSPAVAGGVVFVTSYDGKVYALNAATGVWIWEYDTGDHVGSSPAIADGRVFVGSYDGKVYAFGNPYTTTVGGEIVQTSFITRLIVPAVAIVGIFVAIIVLAFVRIKPSKQTQTEPHKT